MENKHKMVDLSSIGQKDIDTFVTNKLSTVDNLLPEDYKIGYKEGIERFIEFLKSKHG